MTIRIIINILQTYIDMKIEKSAANGPLNLQTGDLFALAAELGELVNALLLYHRAVYVEADRVS